MTRPSVLVAPDSFKGTFTAPEVAQAISAGLAAADVESDPCPAGDGGEGTMDALLQAMGGAEHTATVADPLGRPVTARFGIVGGNIGIVECAEASGLGLVEPSPEVAFSATSQGTGELIAEAIERGATRVLVTVGGSATTDGGVGAIRALEARGGVGDVVLEVVCDVRTPFESAARVFGPQKGADPATIRRLTARLDNRAARLPRDPRGVPMTGCAGGLSGGLWASYAARLRPGAAFVLDVVGFDARASAATVVVCGEGRLDSQTAEGKLVAEIAGRCGRLGRPVHAIVGRNDLEARVAAGLGLASVVEAQDLAGLRDAAERLGANLRT